MQLLQINEKDDSEYINKMIKEQDIDIVIGLRFIKKEQNKYKKVLKTRSYNN